MHELVPRSLADKLAALKILVVDDDPSMRKVIRAMLAAFGIRTVYEAGDGAAGLDALGAFTPDIVLVDWEMPLLDGIQFVQMVRSPGAFPVPDVPIIMLTGHGDRWRVIEAARIGVHEYLLKPVSTKALLDRIISVVARPSQFVQLDGYYGLMPRKLVDLAGTENDIFLLN